MSLTLDDIKKLSEPFDEQTIGVKIQATNKDKNKAMLICYVQHTDAYVRLESVDPQWSSCVLKEGYLDVPDVRGAMKKTYVVSMQVTVKGVSRQNVGEGEDPKSAYSDAFKRCAMLFGVGRYLYDSETVWVPYNETTDKYKTWTYADVKGHRNAPAVGTQNKPSGNGKPQSKPANNALGSLQSIGDYVVNFGKKHKGKKLSSITNEDLKSYIAYIRGEAVKNGETLRGDVKEFVEAAEFYLKDSAS